LSASKLSLKPVSVSELILEIRIEVNKSLLGIYGRLLAFCWYTWNDDTSGLLYNTTVSGASSLEVTESVYCEILE